jgi:glycosyltransferase involved in cell wall biosynthesis
MPKLAVAIITYNEETNIRRTLESVKWADEIVVVDSGSTDGTTTICREYTDKVIHQEWLGYARQKNCAIDKAAGDWVLSLDADEPIEPELAEEIRAIIDSPGALDGYRIPRKTFFLGKQVRFGGWYPDYNLRLFRKGKGRFEERAVHESIKMESPTGCTKNAILHYAYPDLASYMTSIDKYSSLAAVMAEKGIIGSKQGGLTCFPSCCDLCVQIFFGAAFGGKHGELNLFHSYYVFAKCARREIP